MEKLNPSRKSRLASRFAPLAKAFKESVKFYDPNVLEPDLVSERRKRHYLTELKDLLGFRDNRGKPIRSDYLEMLLDIYLLSEWFQLANLMGLTVRGTTWESMIYMKEGIDSPPEKLKDADAEKLEPYKLYFKHFDRINSLVNKRFTIPRLLYMNEFGRIYQDAKGDLLHFLGLFGVQGYEAIEKVSLNGKTFDDAKDKLQEVERKIVRKLEEKRRSTGLEEIKTGEYVLSTIGVEEPVPVGAIRAGEDILRFSDGSKWVLLDESACSLEARAMRHCGNANFKEGDLVLSFRTPGKKKGTWVPHLTFIINGGFLGEMKGYANQKPDKKYFPYIFELLKHDIVRGILGGGYIPENNFSPKDLSKEQIQELKKLKPFLVITSKEGHEAYIKHFGLEPWMNEIVKRFSGFNSFSFTGGTKQWTMEAHPPGTKFTGSYIKDTPAYVTLFTAKDIYDLDKYLYEPSRPSKKWGSSTLRLAKALEDAGADIHVSIAIRDINFDSFIEELKKRSPKYYGYLIETISAVEPGKEFDSYNDLFDELRHDEDVATLIEIFRSAMLDGYYVGTSDAAFRAAMASLNDPFGFANEILIEATYPEEPIEVRMLLTDFIQFFAKFIRDFEGQNADFDNFAEAILELSENQVFREPEYDYDYNDEAAYSRFVELIEEHFAYIKKQNR